MENKIKLPHTHDGISQDVLKDLPSEEDFARGSGMFAILGDMTRLKIFWMLCHCEECVINIAATMEMSSPAVSHHLKILKSSGFIKSRKDGKEVYYTVAQTQDARVLHLLVDTFFRKGCLADQLHL